MKAVISFLKELVLFLYERGDKRFWLPIKMGENPAILEKEISHAEIPKDHIISQDPFYYRNSKFKCTTAYNWSKANHK